MRVEVYRNLAKNTFSIREHGLVTGWVDRLIIENAKLVVQPAGNRRVREEGRKNVHAFIRGTQVYGMVSALVPHMRKLTYNPYQHTSFVDLETQEPVREAALVVLDILDGVHYAQV